MRYFGGTPKYLRTVCADAGGADEKSTAHDPQGSGVQPLFLRQQKS